MVSGNSGRSQRQGVLTDDVIVRVRRSTAEHARCRLSFQ